MKRLPASPSPRDNRGIALLITVVLLAFLVLVIVSLSTITRVETQITTNGQRAAQARQNALFALNVAVGQLQKYAGPDGRITHMADLTERRKGGSANNNPYWTGVSLQNPLVDPFGLQAVAGEPIAWLVSGNDENPRAWTPSAVLDRNSSNDALANVPLDFNPTTGAVTEPGTVRLVWTKTADNNTNETDGPFGVVVPTVPLLAAVPGFDRDAPRPTGRFGYWVSDEGVKANIATPDIGSKASVPIPGNPYFESSDQRRRLGQMIAVRSGPDALPDFNLGSQNNDAVRWAGLDSVMTYQQLFFAFAAPAGTNGGVAQSRRIFLKENFHSLTTYSRGVLTDVVNAQLKRNMSYTAAAGIKAWNQFRPTGPTLAKPAITPSQEAIDSGIKPIISEYVLEVVPYRDSSDSLLKVGFRFRAEFWNPYPIMMPHPAGSVHYQVTVAGLPTLTVKDNSGGTIGTANLDTVLDVPTNGPLIFQGFNQDFTSKMWVRSCEPVTRNAGMAPIADATPAVTSDNRLSYEYPAGTLTITVSAMADTDSDGNMDNPVTMYQYAVPYAAGSRGPFAWGGPGNTAFGNLGAGYTNTSAVVAQGLAFHRRIDAAIVGWSDLGLTELRSLSGGSLWEEIDPDPGAVAQSIYFDNADDPFDGELDGTDAFRSLAPAFDLPAQAPLSLGALHFAPNVNGATASFQVGSPSQGAVNGIFDAGYLLPLPNLATDWSPYDVQANPRYQIIPLALAGGVTKEVAHGDLTTADSRKGAEYLLIQGAFNVNSTSANAWAAVLGGALDQWTAKSFAGQIDLENPCFYFSQAADLITTDWSTAERGRLVLRPSGATASSDEYVQELARQIASRVAGTASGYGGDTGPFRSMADFINSGLVQDAIDNTAVSGLGLNDGVGESRVITQAILLNRLLPFLTVRSDTFVIRTFGGAINPVTGEEEAKAYLEAVVQRMPEFVDPADSAEEAFGNLNATNEEFGRRFRIVSLRWLTPNDI